ncbi:hypothetical protein V8G54_036322 [Vigna mungo]|uniref:Uncharacterized protein n=1 Tax=Vigna mungo TaxID=3915 RepID=A0AAQ3RFC6_VIGMU
MVVLILKAESQPNEKGVKPIEYSGFVYSTLRRYEQSDGVSGELNSSCTRRKRKRTRTDQIDLVFLFANAMHKRMSFMDEGVVRCCGAMKVGAAMALSSCARSNAILGFCDVDTDAFLLCGGTEELRFCSFDFQVEKMKMVAVAHVLAATTVDSLASVPDRFK